MADRAAERLSAIRATYEPIATHASQCGWASEDDAWDELGPFGVLRWRASTTATQALELVDVLEAVLAAKPSMHNDHEPIPDECRFCEGEAAALRKVRDLITNHLTHDSEEET